MEGIYWTAIYEDGEELSQFNEDGSENLFGEIDQSRLMMFELRDSTDKIWIVDLQNGSFKIGDEVITFEGYEGVDYRLIYFRRVRQLVGVHANTNRSVVQQWAGKQLFLVLITKGY